MKRIATLLSAPALICAALVAVPQAASAHAQFAAKSTTCRTALDNIPAGKRLAFNAQADCSARTSAVTYRSHDTAAALAAGCSVQQHPKAAGKVGVEMPMIHCPAGAAPAGAAYTH
jgi:methionine-rich copper-binding protein CopC